MLTQGFLSKTGDAVGAASKALSVLERTVERQAYYLAYLDTFRLIAIFFVVVLPLTMFLTTKKKTAAEIAATNKAAAEAH
jgi:DHA2 family multidrug resistance protein